MDYRPNPDNQRQPSGGRGYYQYTQPPIQPDKRSRPMTTAAVVLSIIAVSTSCCIYLSVACGALGIIFALLSKGGELTMSQTAKTALIISIAGIVLTIGMTVASFAFMLAQYGSFDAFFDAYLETMQAYGIQPAP